jgi:rhomboid protease GluP
MCRNCGAIIGAGKQQCAVCGASMTNAAVSQKPPVAADHETVRFARAVLNRPYKFTVVLLAANLFVFLLMWHSSGMSFSVLALFPTEVLIAYGAKLNVLINEQRQWWRLVTPMFVHVNLLHLMVNMYSLWVVGPYVEKLYGSAKFVVFWVLSGIAGLVASYLTVVEPGTQLGPLGRFLFKLQDGPSAGASGGLFGLVGVLFVFGIKFRHELPQGFKRAFGTGLLPMIILNLFIGYVGRGIIDNAAHLGGLACGALLALFVAYRRPGERSRIVTVWQILQIAMIGLVGISFIKTAQHFRDPLPTSLFEESTQINHTNQFISYVKAMNYAQEAFYLILKERDVKRADEAVKALDSAPQLDAKSNELKEKLKALVIEAKTLSLPDEKSTVADQNVAQQSQNELTRGFAAWSKEYNAWLKTSGRSYAGLSEVSETPAP